MKQHITKEQWDELDTRQKSLYIYEPAMHKDWGEKTILSATKLCDKDMDKMGNYPNIGQMIEFLGVNFRSLIYWDDTEWTVSLDKDFMRKEPVDALWEAVKYKLK